MLGLEFKEAIKAFLEKREVRYVLKGSDLKGA